MSGVAAQNPLRRHGPPVAGLAPVAPPMAACEGVATRAGAQPTADWLRQGGDRARTTAFTVVAAVSFVVAAVITPPLVPVTALHDTPIVALNYDAGETVAWPPSSRRSPPTTGRARSY